MSSFYKRCLKIFSCTLIAIIIVAGFFFSSKDSEAKIRKKTGKKYGMTWKLKNGTLTVSGNPKKGKADYFFERDKRIKKVIIKKSVKEIPSYMFSHCKNLKKVKFNKGLKGIGEYAFDHTIIKKVNIPSSVKEVGLYSFNSKKNITKLTIPGNFTVTGTRDKDENNCWVISNKKIKKVVFNTELLLDNINLLKSDNFKMFKDEKNYIVKNKLIYSKQTGELVRIPIITTSAVVPDNVTSVSKYAFLSFIPRGENYDFGKNIALKELVLGKSVNKITNNYPTYYNSDYYDYNNDFYLDTENKVKVKVTSPEILDGESIANLISVFTPEELLSIFTNSLMLSNGVYITSDGIVIAPEGRVVEKGADKRILSVNEKIIIPENAKKIAAYAFYDSSIKEIIVPNSVSYIGEEAFCNVEKVYYSGSAYTAEYGNWGAREVIRN